MTDPEIEHARLVSGDAGSVRAVSDELMGVLHDLVGVRSDLADAQDVPVWSGLAAITFASRAAGLRQGLSTTRCAATRSTSTSSTRRPAPGSRRAWPRTRSGSTATTAPSVP